MDYTLRKGEIGKYSILIVEDDVGLNQLISIKLEKAGIETVQAFNGADAIKYALEHPDVILLIDLNLPDMHAKDVIKAVADEIQGIPFVVITGLEDEKIAVEMIELGARDYLVKEGAFIEILPRVLASVIKELENDKKLVKARQALAETEGKFEGLVERARDTIIIVRNSNIEYVNAAVINMIGESIEEVIGRPFAEFVHPDDLPGVVDNYKRRLAGEDVSSIYEIDLIVDGKRKPVELNAGLVPYNGELADLVIIRDISKRKEAEEKIRIAYDEREQLERIVNQSEAIVFLMKNEPGWQIEFVSDNIGHFGYQAADFYKEHLPYTRIIHKDDLERVVSEVEHYIKEDWDVFSQEYRIYTKAGDIRWVDVRVLMRRNGIGDVTHFQGTLMDITARKNAETALAREQEKARKYLDIAGVMIVALNIYGEVTLINQKGCEVLGYKEADIIGKNWFSNYIPGENRDEVSGVFDKLMLGEIEPVKDYENTVVNSSGEYRMIAWHNNVLTDDLGKIIGTLSSGEDITARKEAEDALKDSEERYRSLQHNIPVGVYRTTVEYPGHFISANPVLADMFGYDSPDELEETDLIAIYHNPQRRDELVNELKHNGKVVDFEIQFRRKDNSKFWGNVNARLFSNDDGSMQYVDGVLEDITERKIANEKLKASLGEKEILIREIHHRVKNNLQIISSLVNLQSIRIDDNKYKWIFEETRNRVRSMALIHEKLYGSEDLAQIDIGSYVKELVSFLYSSYDVSDSDIQIKTLVDDTRLPINKATPCGLILNELISNSLKHGYPDGGKGTITVEITTDEKQNIRFAISDDGVGIPQNVNFESNRTLGLQVVSALVNQLEGSINLNRENGTSVIIIFKKDEKIT